jgi:exonuclease SbcD
MKVIHTSDWHIGRRFERESMEADQRELLEWLAGQVRNRQVDLVIVAGDIYDRSLPAEDAVAVLDAGLNAIRLAGATVIMISGNHDSPRRLGFGAKRQALGGVHIFADDLHPPTPYVFEAGDERVAIVAVPFLDPQITPAPKDDEEGNPRRRTHENALIDAMTSGRDKLNVLGSMPTIAVAHAFVTGAQTSDSEKLLAIGGADAVDASVFDGFDYVALGHLHRPQRIGGQDTVAYSGSPLPYSFSEDHAKSVRLIELTGSGIESIEELTIPVGRPVCTITGGLESLLNSAEHERYRDYWVAARLTDEHAQAQPMERLRARFPHIVSVRYDTQLRGPILGPGDLGNPIEDRSPEELVLDFLTELRERPATETEQSLVLDAVAAAVAGSHS